MIDMKYVITGIFGVLIAIPWLICYLKDRKIQPLIICITIVAVSSVVIYWGIFGKPIRFQLQEAKEFVYHLNPLYKLAENKAMVYWTCHVGIMLGIIGIAVVIINKVVKYRRNKQKRYW